MRGTGSARTWHAWLSVVWIAPLFVVGMTTFFIAHERALGLKEIAWGTEPPELRDVLHRPDGSRLLVTKSGVYAASTGRLEPIPALRATEIRRLEALPDGRILAAGKEGLWVGASGGEWWQVYSGDVHSVRVSAGGRWRIITKLDGPLSSSDSGRSWSADEGTLRLLGQLPAGNRNLGKLIHDLHTGKALFGKNGEWIWIDLVGFVLVFLCATGSYLWWRTRRRTF